MNIKLGDNYNLLVSSHFDEIFLINSDEDIRSISGEGIEDVYKIISWVKENKIISRDEVISFFKEYDLEYVNNIVDWLLDEEIFIIEDNTIDKTCVFFCCDEKIVSLIKENNNSSIFINNIDSLQGFKTIDLLVVIYPFAGLKNIYQEIDKFSLNRNVKTLYVDLYEKSISIGPLMSLKEGTCSLECLITRRLNNAQDSIKFKKFIDNNFVFNDFFIDTTSYTTKSSILLLLNEIRKILNNEDHSLYSKIKEINYLNFTLEQYFVIKDYNSSIFNTNINMAFNG